MRNKISVILAAVIMAAAASLSFLVADITALFIASYIFTISAIVVMLGGNLLLISDLNRYPWGAAIPQAAWKYAFSEFLVSATAVILEQAVHINVPITWFIVVQCVIFAFFAVKVIALNYGLEEIDRVEDKIKTGTFEWKSIILDLETIAEKAPAVKPLLESVKYSDPVANTALAEYDAKIREGVSALEKAVGMDDTEGLNVLCENLQRLLKDRNNRVKLLKNR